MMYRVIILALLLVVSYGCAKDVEVDREADFYRTEGDALLAEGKYKKASEWYEQALMRAENPEYAANIQLSLADSYFLAGNYIDAIPVYEVYLDVYRNSESAKLATVRVGIAYFNLVKYASRDQTNTAKSLQYLIEVKEKYPDLVEEYQVDERIYLLRERLAKKEMIIAKYYACIHEPEPELLRYKYIIEHFSDTIYYGEAMDRINRLLLKQNKLSEAKEYLELFRNTTPEDKRIVKCEERIAKYEKKQADIEAKKTLEEKKDSSEDKEAVEAEKDSDESLMPENADTAESTEENTNKDMNNK